MNGNPKSDKFDVFLEWVVWIFRRNHNERWQGDIMHMPLAISIHHLWGILYLSVYRRSIQRCQHWMDKIAVLAYSSAALRYTGKFKVKYGVHVRKLRKDHPDARYMGLFCSTWKGALFSTDLLFEWCPWMTRLSYLWVSLAVLYQQVLEGITGVTDSCWWTTELCH